MSDLIPPRSLLFSQDCINLFVPLHLILTSTLSSWKLIFIRIPPRDVIPRDVIIVPRRAPSNSKNRQTRHNYEMAVMTGLE